MYVCSSPLRPSEWLPERRKIPYKDYASLVGVAAVLTLYLRADRDRIAKNRFTVDQRLLGVGCVRINIGQRKAMHAGMPSVLYHMKAFTRRGEGGRCFLQKVLVVGQTFPPHRTPTSHSLVNAPSD